MKTVRAINQSGIIPPVWLRMGAAFLAGMALTAAAAYLAASIDARPHRENYAPAQVNNREGGYALYAGITELPDFS